MLQKRIFKTKMPDFTYGIGKINGEKEYFDLLHHDSDESGNKLMIILLTHGA